MGEKLTSSNVNFQVSLPHFVMYGEDLKKQGDPKVRR